MKIRTATNRRLRTAGALMIALSVMGTAACGGSEEVLEGTATDAVEVSDEVAAEPAEETTATVIESSNQSSSQASSQSSDQASSSQSSSSQSGSTSGSTGGGVTGQATAEQPAAEPAEQPAAEPAAEPAADEPAPEPAAEEIVAEDEPTEEPVEEPAPEPAPVAPVISAEFLFTSPLDVEVAAQLLGFEGSNTKGIASVCMVQYNEYGNPIYRNGDPYRRNEPSVEVDGVRYPAVLVQGCAPSTENLGVYTKTWSVEGERGVNNSIKPYLDIAIRAEDGQVKVFCIDTTVRNAQFVERNMADYANRTSMGACRY